MKVAEIFHPRQSSLTIRSWLAHVATSSHDFIYEKELLTKNWRDVQELLFDDVVVPDMSLSGRQWLSCQNIHSKRFLVSYMGVLNLDKRVLGIKTWVLSKGTWNNEQCLSKTLNTKLCFSRNFSASGPLGEMLMSCNFESSSSWNDRLIFNSVLDSSKSVTNSILRLCNWVVVRSLDKNSAGEGVLDSLDKSVLIISKRLLVYKLSESKIGLLYIFDGVDLFTAAGKRNSLTISALSSSDSDDASTSKNLKRRWIDTFLIDDNEILVCSIAEALFKFHDLVNTIISELSLGFNQFLALISVWPEETRVDFSFLILKRNVEAHDIAILQTTW